MNQALPADPPGDAPPRRPLDLPPDLLQSTVSEIAVWLVGHTLDEVERELIRHTLENCGGDRVLAASVLGISLPVLRRKINAYAVRGQALPEPKAEPKAEPSKPACESRADLQANEGRALVPIPQADNNREPEPAAAAVKPEKPKMMDVRLLIGGVLSAVLIALIGLGLFGGSRTGADFVAPERARIELSVVERPLPFEQRIVVPTWNAPQPLRAEPAVMIDIAADKRIEAPAREVMAAFDSAQDTGMEIAAAPADKAGGRAPADAPLTAADIPDDTPAALAAADISQDTRMDLAALSEGAASAAPDDTAPETTGSIGSDAMFVAPEDVPEPPARAAPAAPAKAAAPVQRRAARPRAAPAQAATPAPAVPLLFPFSLFAAKNAQGTGGGTPGPYDCCVNN